MQILQVNCVEVLRLSLLSLSSETVVHFDILWLHFHSIFLIHFYAQQKCLHKRFSAVLAG